MTNKNLLQILFIEDLASDVDLEVLELRKEKLKFEHTTVCTSVDLFKALKEFKPDLIISDYMMPAFNGLQALKEVKKFNPEIPFILCTGSINEETAVECIKAGADDYVIKEHLTRLPFAVKEALEQNLIEKEKKAAELLLRENEEKLQSIFRAAPVGIGLIVNKVILEANDTLCTMTGFSRKELIGKNFIMVFASGEEYDDAEIEKYRQIAEKGTGSVETRFKCKDGRIITILLNSSPFDKDDLKKGVTITVMGMTERRLSEEALKRTLLQQDKVNLLQQSLLTSESITRKLNIITESIVQIFDADFCRIWLIQPGDLCEKGCIHALNLEGPHVCKYRDLCLHLKSSSGRYTHTDGEVHRRVPFGCYKIGQIASSDEHKFISNDVQNDPRIHNPEWTRELGLVSFVGYQIRAPGSPTTGVLALFSRHQISASEDIILDGISSTIGLIVKQTLAEEALKISEERFRTAAENLTDVVYDWDIKEKVDWYGDIDGIMGFPSGGFPRTIKGWAATIHPEDKDRVMTALEGHLKGLSPYQIEYRIGRRDGEWRWWSARGNALRDNRGEPCKMIGSITDITERKRTEQELIDREARYKTLIENIPQKIFMKSRDYRWISVNENLARDFGISPEEIVGKLDYDLFPRELADKYHADDVRIIKTGKTEEFDEKYVVAGKVTWINTIKTPVRDMNGEIVGLLGIFWDITERRQAEDKLRSSEERLKILFDYAPDAYYLSDLKGILIDGNLACEELLGYHKNDMIGKSFLKLNLLSLKELPKAAKLLIDNALGQRTGPDEFMLNRKDGSKVPVEIITHPVKIKDKTLVLGMARDITERRRAVEALKESEEKFRSIMENSADAIFITDQKGKYLYINKAVTDMLGFTAEEMQSKTVVDLAPPNKINEYFETFKKVLTEGKIFIEIELLRKDGSFISTDLNSVLLPGGMVYGSCRDITEKKQIQEELLKHRSHLEELVKIRTEELTNAKKEAEEANKAKSEFLANMSHEIRTPMNAVLGYTELLSSTTVDQTQKNYIDSIKSSGRSLLTLINDILDLSKIEAGKLDLEFDYVDTYSFFTEFERIFSHKVSEKGLKFILDITSGTPAGIYIDEARVRQIVFNLIGNAIKFTSEGKIVLKVFTENPQIVNYSKEKSEELINLIIKIEDTGIGITKDLQKAIFEPFVQGRDNKHYGGTGLGLTITMRLAVLMNGTINMQSKPGKGSIFTVMIPEIAYLRDFSKPRSDFQINPAEIVFEEKVILIADDVKHNRDYLRDALKSTKLKIAEAEDGVAAYKLANKIVPDLIIADIRMPKMDGFQLLDKLKSDDKLKHIPVIAYSASVLKAQKERIHNSEFAGLLIKPVKVSELYLELMNFLPYKSTREAESGKPLSEVDLIGEINDLPGLIHSLETDFHTTWKTFSVRQPIGEIRAFGKNLIQSGLDHNSSIITGYGKELISAADSFNIEAVLKLIEKYNSIIESLKDPTKNLNNA